MTIPFTLTNESITVVYNGKAHVVQRGQPQFVNLRNALLAERWEEVPSHLTVAKSLSAWAKGRFTVNETLEEFSYDGAPLPKQINSRIISMAAAGKDPTPLFLFYERLQRNPSMRSVEQLYKFLQHTGIPFTTDGCLLAYKGVKNDYTDQHTGKVDNRPGTVNKMARNKISDDPREACHFGFHVGALTYARTFSQRVIICKVDPEHVVCVPYDHSERKMRVCEYKVIGNYGEILPDDIFDENAPAPRQDDPTDDNDKAFNGEPGDEDDEREPDSLDTLMENDDEDEEDEETEEPVEEEVKAEEPAIPAEPIEGVPAKKNQKLKIPKKFKKLVDLDYEGYMKQTISALREFAVHGLHIVGAAHIRGGKVQLIAKIIEVRDGKQ
jgi:hypothetical protein